MIGGNTVPAKAMEVVGFWRAAGSEAWYRKDDAFDSVFRDRFFDLHMAAARRELEAWEETSDGALALLILLDQFPRNCFRGTAHMYATDPLARHYADRAIARGHDHVGDPETRQFFYLPFMHSEDLQDQERCVRLCEPLGEDTMKYAIEHRDIVERFGRFPHRNPILTRISTPEEEAFLAAGGFAG